MTKIQKNYWIDIVLLLSGLICVLSGYILDFRLISREWIGFYKNLHSISAYLMTIAMILHFIFHWNWMLQVSRQLVGKKSPAVSAVRTQTDKLP